jgi:exodeoxyribonuclease V
MRTGMVPVYRETGVAHSKDNDRTRENLGYNANMVEPTKEQKEALKALFDWFISSREPYVSMGGYAGTGKTTLLGMWRKLLHKMQPKLRVAFCAYTGKASQVLEMSLTLQQARLAQDSVSTIHSLIYSPKTNTQGHITGWRKKESIHADLIIVDEASMVDRDIFTDLLAFAIPVMAIGDHGQLPPVKGSFHLMKEPMIRLETIHRQAAESPIIQVSIMAREEGVIPVKIFGPGVRKLSRYESSSGQEVEEMLMRFNEDMLVLTGFNHTRIKLNQSVRAMLGIEGERPRINDRVVCLRNNWDAGIYNGMSGTIGRIIPKQNEKGGIDWYEAEIDLAQDGRVYGGLISAHQFNQPQALQGYKQLTYKTIGDLFDFGYALTVHKAQGSQAPRVLLFEERSQHMSDEDWRRWLYTGITRAEEELTIVGL